MREAFFATIFCGIETPDPVRCKAMHKDHNMMVPIMDAIETLNGFGMEVVSGIILGPRHRQARHRPASARVHRSVADSAPDHQSSAGAAEDAAVGPAERENRLIEDDEAATSMSISGCLTTMCVTTWRDCMGSAYQPDKLFERYEHQIRDTFPNRLQPPHVARASVMARTSSSA